MAGAPDATVTVILRGYFSRRLPVGGKTFSLPLAETPTARAAVTRLGVPLPAIGLVLINRQQGDLDTSLQGGDTVELLPLLGGGGDQHSVLTSDF